jgi:hypothetical protein
MVFKGISATIAILRPKASHVEAALQACSAMQYFETKGHGAAENFPLPTV